MKILFNYQTRLPRYARNDSCPALLILTKKTLKKFLTAILFFSSFSLFAQTYSYDDLRNSVFQNHPELLKLQEEYERSLLDVKDAKAGLGPSIDLEVSGTYLLNPPVDAIYLNVDDVLNSIQWPGESKPASTGQYVKIYDGMENTLYNFGLKLTQPVWTWGKITNAIKLYQKIADIKEIQILSKQQEIEIELETRLVTLTYLQQILQILEEEKTYADRMVEVSEHAEKTGMLLHQDVVDARIQAKQLEMVQIEINEQIVNQLLELERITGIEKLSINEIDFEIDEQWFEELLAKDRTELEKNALSQNQLSIKMLDDLKEVNELAVKISKGYENWKPDFAVQMSAGYGGSRFPLVEPNWLRKDEYSANISIGMKTTVWDGGKKLNDIARKKSEAATTDVNKLDARSTIKKTLASKLNEADLCSIKIEYQDLKIESAQAKIKQKETVYNSGYGTETDLLSAKIDCCNETIEKLKQQLQRAVACMTIDYLSK